jgi:hypothetical protein
MISSTVTPCRSTARAGVTTVTTDTLQARADPSRPVAPRSDQDRHDARHIPPRLLRQATGHPIRHRRRARRYCFDPAGSQSGSRAIAAAGATNQNSGWHAGECWCSIIAIVLPERSRLLLSRPLVLAGRVEAAKCACESSADRRVLLGPCGEATGNGEIFAA